MLPAAGTRVVLIDELSDYYCYGDDVVVVTVAVACSVSRALIEPFGIGHY